LETQPIKLDKSNMISNAAQTQLKLLGAPGGSFDALLSQLTQMGVSQDVAAEMPQPAPPPKIASDEALSLSTPVEKLEYSLGATGQPLERFEVPADDRDKLQVLLEESGYSEEDAESILNRASNEDGSINLGAMFQVMQDYTPKEGPVLRIAAADKPQFVQILKELGLGEDQIKNIADSMQLKDGFYELQNLNDILKAAEEAQKLYGYKGSVDKGLLQNLLGQLGLSKDEIATLLEQGTDSQGNLRPDAALEILKKAAAKQDKGISQALKELAGKVRVTASETGTPHNPAADAKRIKEQVNKILQVMDDNASKGQTNLKEALQAALAEDGDNQAEGQFKNLGQVISLAAKNPTQVKPAADSAAAQEDKQQAFQFAREQANQNQAKAESATADSSGKTNSTAKASGQGIGLSNGPAHRRSGQGRRSPGRGAHLCGAPGERADRYYGQKRPKHPEA
jgi:flagellar hook-length control protein FliK